MNESARTIKAPRKLARRGIAQIAAITASFIVGTFVAVPAAQAVTYNADYAASYAIKFTCNRNNSCRNPDYKVNSNDCANLVSQALYAGGLSTDGYWWNQSINQSTGKISDAWGKATNLYSWLTGTKGWTSHSLNNMFGGGDVGVPKGSVIEYDWGGGEGYSHVAIVSGTGTYSDFTDPDAHIGNYRTATGHGSGTKIVQHSTDRDGAPWNLGYWTNDLSWRKNAKARWVLPGK